jgi:signal recognition particle GTPase
MSSAGGSNLAMTTTITPPQVIGTKRALPVEDHDRPKKKARTEKKKDEGAKANKSKKKNAKESDYSDSEEEHSQTPPLSRVNSLGADFDVTARLKLLEDQQKQMEQQLEALKGELVLKDFVIKEVKTISSTMADPQTKSEKEVRPKRKAGRPKKKYA